MFLLPRNNIPAFAPVPQKVSGLIVDGKDEDLKSRVNDLSCLVLGGTVEEVDDWKDKIDTVIDKTGHFKSYSGNLDGVVRLFRNKVAIFGCLH